MQNAGMPQAPLPALRTLQPTQPAPMRDLSVSKQRKIRDSCAPVDVGDPMFLPHSPLSRPCKFRLPVQTPNPV